jgi:hypothetical protein
MTKIHSELLSFNGGFGRGLVLFTHVPAVRLKQPRWLYVHAILYIFIHFMILRPIVAPPMQLLLANVSAALTERFSRELARSH